MAEAAMEPTGGDRDRDGDTTAADRGERDYGDAAGYGGGGSTLDYDELLGDENSRRDIGPNPLDAVVHTNRDEHDGGGDPAGTDAAADRTPGRN